MYILVRRGEYERRIVTAISEDHLKPLLDIGFIPYENGDTVEEAIRYSQVENYKSLVSKLCIPGEPINNFKNVENTVRKLFEPIEVLQLYREQQGYESDLDFEICYDDY